MQQSEPDNRASRLLTEFENLENIQSSDGWEEALFIKLRSSRSGYPNSKKAIKPIVFVACLFIINALFFIRLVKQDENQINKRNEALQSISNELLIKSSTSS